MASACVVLCLSPSPHIVAARRTCSRRAAARPFLATVVARWVAESRLACSWAVGEGRTTQLGPIYRTRFLNNRPNSPKSGRNSPKQARLGPGVNGVCGRMGRVVWLGRPSASWWSINQDGLVRIGGGRGCWLLGKRWVWVAEEAVDAVDQTGVGFDLDDVEFAVRHGIAEAPEISSIRFGQIDSRVMRAGRGCRWLGPWRL